MKPELIAAAAALACLCPAAQAGGDPYGEGLSSYKAELKRDAPDLANGDFYGTLASSQAKRALLGTDANSADLTVSSAAGGSRSRSARGGSVNVASPQIFGTVRGNVTVVVQRGAVRGSITSVDRH